MRATKSSSLEKAIARAVFTRCALQIPASGKRFRLAEERIKVKVEDGKIKKMVVLPTKGAGPQALYEALSEKTPAAASLDN